MDFQLNYFTPTPYTPHALGIMYCHELSTKALRPYAPYA